LISGREGGNVDADYLDGRRGRGYFTPLLKPLNKPNHKSASHGSHPLHPIYDDGRVGLVGEVEVEKRRWGNGN